MPSTSTNFAFATGVTTATVEGEVDPGGQTTEYHVAYDLASSEWCTSHGSKGSPAHSTTPVTLGFTDGISHFVPVGLSGLTAGSEYCVELVAVNGSGTGQGLEVYFGAGLPSTSTNDTFATGASTATVEGELNPAGQATKYHIAYDLASSEWCTSFGSKGSPAHSTTSVTLGFTDAASHFVSVTLNSLTAGAMYCAELLAVNGSGTGHGSQVSFTAGLPSAFTVSGASATGATTATIAGEVDSAGQTTEYHVAYDLASSEWCTSFGSKGSPAHSTTPVTLGFTDATFHPVSVPLSGLTGGVMYCAELVAVNGSGTGHAFTAFTAGIPHGSAYEAFATGVSTATIEGSVNPAGQATEYHIVYDLASSEWCTSHGSKGSPARSTTPVTLGFTDAAFHEVSVTLGGLTAGTGYCAELVMVNGSGTGRSGFQTSFTAGVPSFVNVEGSFFLSATGPTTALAEGKVNPAGQVTEYHAAYDLASSEWCESFGATGAPAHSTPPVTLGFTDGTFHSVSVAVSGLTAGTEYCAELVAVNGSGTAHGGQAFLTAGLPSAFILGASVTGATTATVEGEVDPAGQVTEYHVAYDVASGEWCTSGGVTGSPAHSTTPVTLGFTDATFHPASVALSGLTAGTEYCAEMVSVNGSGTGRGFQISFTAGVSQKPTVTKVAPANGTTSGGTLVTITGTGLQGATAVDFGASGATIKTDTATELTVESPAHSAGQVDVTVTTSGGTSATSETDHYTYETPPQAAPSPPGGQSGGSSGTGGGGGGVLGSTTRVPPAPAVGTSEQAAPVSGTVLIKPPGAHSFTPLTSTTLIPDGSEVDATNGRIRLLVASGVPGVTNAVELYGGRFIVHQTTGATPRTYFILSQPLTGCQPPVGPAHIASATEGIDARAKGHKGPRSRHLWVTEHGGRFNTEGQYVSTSVEGTTWLTSDTCTSSSVTVSQGVVKVRDLVRRKTVTLHAGRSYTARKRH